MATIGMTACGTENDFVLQKLTECSKEVIYHLPGKHTGLYEKVYASAKVLVVIDQETNKKYEIHLELDCETKEDFYTKVPHRISLYHTDD
ncbi:MAG: hypothetical protein V1855_04830 [bacterium]